MSKLKEKSEQIIKFLQMYKTGNIAWEAVGYKRNATSDQERFENVVDKYFPLYIKSYLIMHEALEKIKDGGYPSGEFANAVERMLRQCKIAGDALEEVEELGK